MESNFSVDHPARSHRLGSIIESGNRIAIPQQATGLAVAALEAKPTTMRHKHCRGHDDLRYIPDNRFHVADSRQLARE